RPLRERITVTPPESLFAPWETFYVIVGSAGGALTGLLFVVVALVADRATSGTERGLSAFTTPSVFHFVLVMAISAVVTMPRHSLISLSVLLVVCALVGTTITIIATWRIMTFEQYKPVAEDWLSHGVVPGAAYVALLIAAIVLPTATELASYLIASTTLV